MTGRNRRRACAAVRAHTGFGIQPGEARLLHLIPSDRRISIVGIAEKYISRACVWNIREEDKACQMEVLERGDAYLAEQRENSFRYD